MQILDVICRGHWQVQVVNVYDALQMSNQVQLARAVE
jgi:hypothetical protein